jgi:hypothetical protein
MEPEGSLPQTQVPVNCPCPKPPRSSPCHTSHFLKIHLNIIFPSTPRSSNWSLYLRLTHQNSVYASPLHHTFYMHRRHHSSRFHHQNNIWWELQVIQLLIKYFFSTPVLPHPFYAQTFSSAPYFRTPSAYVPPQCERPSFKPIKNNRQNYSYSFITSWEIRSRYKRVLF